MCCEFIILYRTFEDVLVLGGFDVIVNILLEFGGQNDSQFNERQNDRKN